MMNNVIGYTAVLDPRKRELLELAIDAAWRSSDPEKVAFQRRHFPEGKPSAFRFICRMKLYALSRVICHQL